MGEEGFSVWVEDSDEDIGESLGGDDGVEVLDSRRARDDFI